MSPPIIKKKEQITQAWNLKKLGVSPEVIAIGLKIDRSTIYRWFRSIRRKGIRVFLKDYEKAKQGRRKRNTTDPIIKDKIYRIRDEYKRCCGEKIKYLLKRNYDINISVSTIYRILGEKYILRSKWKKNQKRGFVIKGSKPRESIQVDTVVLGEIYAFTAIDTYTREVSVILKDKLDSVAGEEAFVEQLRYFQQIERIQRDGGPEFKDKWEYRVRKLNINIRTSRPYKKNEQAYIERFNGILRKECVGHIHYQKKDMDKLQNYINEFIEYYHNKRPHLSLNMLTPAEFSNLCRI